MRPHVLHCGSVMEMGLYQPLSILLFFGFLIELYFIHSDYHTPIPAKVATDTIHFDVANYLDFIANKTIIFNARNTIKCYDTDGAYLLELNLRNKNNIWRFEHRYGLRFVPFRILANSILYGFALAMSPLVILAPVTPIALVIPSILYQILESVLDFAIAVIQFILPRPDKPPTIDLEPLLEIIAILLI